MNLSVEDISNNISEYFSEETFQFIKNNFLKMKQLLLNLKNSLDTNPSEDIMKNAYRIIMIAREFFTGEEIFYRIYYALNDNKTSFNKPVSIYELTEQDILNIVYKEGEQLRIKSSFSEMLKNKKNIVDREKIFEKHWNDLYTGFAEVDYKGSTYYRVHKFIMEKYELQNSFLRKKDNTYQIFNRGNIYESFDITIDDVYKKYLPIINEDVSNIENIYNRRKNIMKDKYFGVYLKKDSIGGFNIGDNNLAQLKARKATLIKIASLKQYLLILLKIFDSNNINKKKIKEIIRKNFTNPELKKLTPDLNNFIDSRIDQLIEFKNLTIQQNFAII